ncbi:MAG: GNAT family N-acetyltransferase [Rubrivivax sp.]
MKGQGLPPALLSRIEDAGLNASAPPQQRWVDGWLVRYSPGKAQRARCVNAVSDGVLPIGERLAICHALYRQIGLPMLMRVTPFTRPVGLDESLARQGYQRFDDTEVMACTVIADTPQAALPADLRIEQVSAEAYAHIIGAFRGTPGPEQEAHLQRMLNCPVLYHGHVLRHADGSVVACGQYALEDDMVGLYDVFTSPHARGQGLSRWLCAQLLARARRQGARLAYLQVDAHNHAARAVYQRLGFTYAYAYHYRALPAAGA